MDRVLEEQADILVSRLPDATSGHLNIPQLIEQSQHYSPKNNLMCFYSTRCFTYSIEPSLFLFLNHLPMRKIKLKELRAIYLSSQRAYNL